MKRTLSLLLAALFALSLGAAFAPAVSADALPAFAEKAEVAYDESTGCLRGFDPGVTVADVKAAFASAVEVTDADGTTLADAAPVFTGCRVVAGSASAKIIVYGDLTGTGSASARDVIAIMRAIVDNDVASIETAAADVDPDGTINASDVIRLMKWLVGFDVELGERFWTVDLSKRDAESEDEGLSLFFVDSTVKNSPTCGVSTGDPSFMMTLARNERESCQVQLYSSDGHDGLEATITEFRNGKGETIDSQLLYEDYIKVVSRTDNSTPVRDLIPDRLPPIEAIGSFGIDANKLQGLYIEVGTEESTRPGLYRARLDISNAEGEVIKTAYVYAKVWDFALPEESSVKTAFGLGFMDAWNRRPKNSDAQTPADQYIKYYEYLLDNRICGWCLPYDPIDSRADRWMDDPRVTSFLVAGGYGGDAYRNMSGSSIDSAAVGAIYNKIKDNPTWMSKQLFYLTDEPGIYWDTVNYPDKIAELMSHKAAVDACFPGARIVIPVHANFWQDQADLQKQLGGLSQSHSCYTHEHRDVLDYAGSFSNVICPSERLFVTYEQLQRPGISSIPDSDVIYERGYYPRQVAGKENEIVETYGTIFERLDGWRNEGKEIWWYTANSPRPPMANISQRSTGMENRMLFWIQYDFDIDGFLYWASVDWTSKKRNTIGEDAGVLVYPGDDFNVDGPIACQRAGIVRDGIEDFEYLRLAEQLLGKDYADSILRQLVTDVVTFSEDSSELIAVRNALGDAIEAALAD